MDVPMVTINRPDEAVSERIFNGSADEGDSSIASSRSGSFSRKYRPMRAAGNLQRLERNAVQFDENFRKFHSRSSRTVSRRSSLAIGSLSRSPTRHHPFSGPLQESSRKPFKPRSNLQSSTISENSTSSSTDFHPPPRVAPRGRTSLPFIIPDNLTPRQYREWQNSLKTKAQSGGSLLEHVQESGGSSLSVPVRSVSQRLSTSIGIHFNLRAESPTEDQVVQETRWILSRYLRMRLQTTRPEFYRRAALKALQTQDLPEFLPGPTRKLAVVVNIIYILLEEMNRTYPCLHSSILAQTGSHCPTAAATAHNAPLVLTLVAREMFRDFDAEWMRIVSLMGVAGGVAADCVAIGQPEAVVRIAEATSDFVERDLACWIAGQGGWQRLIGVVRQSKLVKVKEKMATLLGTMAVGVWLLVGYYFLNR